MKNINVKIIKFNIVVDRFSMIRFYYKEQICNMKKISFSVFCLFSSFLYDDDNDVSYKNFNEQKKTK
jgi:hypothetical protein